MDNPITTIVSAKGEPRIDSRLMAGHLGIKHPHLADYGLASDFVKVRVLGVNSRALPVCSSSAVSWSITPRCGGGADSSRETVVEGVAPARFGDDSSVIWTRVGRDARSFPPIRLRGADTMTLVAKVSEHVNSLRGLGRRVIVNVDGGGVGGGVIDRLRSVGYDVNEVQFGGRAVDPRKWANRRAEIWGALRDWLAGGAIPKDELLATDLTSVEYGYNAADAILLEKKESMKARGLASPDSADALAVTFAVPVPIGVSDDMQRSNRQQLRDYDPYAALERDPYSKAMQALM